MPLFGKKHIQQEAVPASATKKVAVKNPIAKAPKAPKVAKAEKTEKKTKEVAVAPTKGKKGEVVFPKGSVIKRPRVTEKAGMLSEKGIYTFEVSVDANSQQIAQAIKSAYKVTPIKVSVAKIPSKAMFVRGKSGSTSMGKKAYVYLKKGDTIEFI